MGRQDTRLQAEGAEFLVLGHLLIEGVQAYKTYTNMPGYDVVAMNPDLNITARIQVKSRWKTDADGFIIKNFDCDFVVIALLNRGSKEGTAEKRPPEFYVLPVADAEALPRTEGWGKVAFRKVPHLDQYKERWDVVTEFLQMG